jgi:predicted Zn-dependent protease with MMP-like domain
MDDTNRWLLSTARDVVDRTLHSLPDSLQTHARQVPVVLEPNPGPEWTDDGWDPDLLGMFIGAPFGSVTDIHADIPPSIVLFYRNLWDFAERDEHAYTEEVRVTYLHELGHYLGLDEDELEDRGLL